MEKEKEELYCEYSGLPSVSSYMIEEKEEENNYFFAGHSQIHKIKIKNMLLIYYIICIIYCFYQLNKRYRKTGTEYNSPELDAVMVVVMAWVLAPIDVSLTWIRWYKEAEQARIDQTKLDFTIDEEDGIY